MKLRNRFRTAAAAFVAAALTCVAAATGAAAQPDGLDDVQAPAAPAPIAPGTPQPGEGEAAGGTPVQDFGACIAGSGAADIVLVLDQSGSLDGDAAGGWTGDATDPEGKRIAVAKDFIDRMATYSTDAGASINIRVAGFGTGYRAYGDWVNLADGGQGAKDEVDTFVNGGDRTDDLHTDYRAGLSGAFEAARDGAGAEGAEPCKAVLFFSDGKPTAEDADGTAIMDQVCRAGGPVDQMRFTGVRLFTVGLTPPGGSDDPAESLKRISEGDCGENPANGAAFSAGNPNELFRAFREIVPPGAAVRKSGIAATEPFGFTLDDSVTPVRLNVTPDGPMPGGVMPMLTAPNGDRVPLDGTAGTIAGHGLAVTASEALPGMVDVELTKGAGGDWAGPWTFAYDNVGPDAPEYAATLTVVPGLRLDVDGGTVGDDGRLTARPGDTLRVSLVDREGKPRQMAGTVGVTAEATPADGGDAIRLPVNGDLAAAPVTVPVSINERFSGTLRLAAQITTAGEPGTALEPIVADYPLTVVPPDSPALPAAIDVPVSGDEPVEVPVHVTGPGQVWIPPGQLAGDNAAVDYTSDHPDEATALELGPGEDGVVTLTATPREAADATIAGDIPVNYVPARDGAAAERADVPAKVSMTVPVDAGMFAGALIAALLLALVIPVLVLYLMRWITGRIPADPALLSLRIPVAAVGGELRRTDTGVAFTVPYEEMVRAGRTTSGGREIRVGGERLSVSVGANPLTPATVVSDAPLAIADDGGQKGTRAELPLSVHNHWFVVMDPQDERSVAVIIAVDERITRGRLSAIVDGIRAKATERIGALAAQRGPMGPGQQAGPDGPAGPSGQPGPADPPGPRPSFPDRGDGLDPWQRG